jgi:hypothetical protein
MGVATRCHLRALTEVFELVLVGSVVALMADTAWVFHDIQVNGISTQYIGIASGLTFANLLTLWAFKKHHAGNFKKIAHEIFLEKIELQRRRDKRGRRKCCK